MKIFFVAVVTLLVVSQCVLEGMVTSTLRTLNLNRKCGCKTISRGLDANTVQKILEQHNKIRQILANGKEKGFPTASNIKELNWNNDLAKLAQSNADKCKFAHSPNEARKTKKYPNVGENLFWSTHQLPVGEIAKLAVDSWYQEIKSVKPGDMKTYAPDPRTGHYIQIIWANTEAIGCGYVKAAQNKDNYFHCNYGPAGNWIGEAVVKPGAPGTSCKNGKSTKYPGLCK